MSISPADIQKTVRRLDEDVTVIVGSLERIETTQEVHTTAITELQTGMSRVEATLETHTTAITELQSGMSEVQSAITELQTGMSEVLALLRAGQGQKQG